MRLYDKRSGGQINESLDTLKKVVVFSPPLLVTVVLVIFYGAIYKDVYDVYNEGSAQLANRRFFGWG